MKLKSLSFLAISFIIFCSCSDDIENIEGIYQVHNKGKLTDKIYIELVDEQKKMFKISTPNAWEEFATLEDNVLKGEWKYQEDYHDKKTAGKRGYHIATYDDTEKKFIVDIFSDKNKPAGQVSWTKYKSLIKEDIPEEGIIYLTFDDGPFDGTRNVLLALEKTNTKATFFIVGEHAEELRKNHTETFETLKNKNYILLANHSYSHANGKYKKFYKNSKNVIADLKKNENNILNTKGQNFKANIDPKITRLPGRNAWILDEFEFYDLPDVKEISEDLRRFDYDIYGWDVEWDMTNKGEPRVSYKSVIDEIDRKIKNFQTKKINKCVILMHDKMFYNKKDRSSLIKFINKLKAKGYKFKTLKNY